MMKRVLPVAAFSLVLVIGFGYVAQSCSLRFAVNLYPLEYFVLILLTGISMANIVRAKMQVQMPFKGYVLKMVLPILLGIFVLSIASKLLFQIDLSSTPKLSSLLFSQFLLQIYIVFGSCFLLFILNQILWKKPMPMLSGKTFVGALVFIVLTAGVHSICSYISLIQMMSAYNSGQSPVSNYTFVGMLYGIQEGITFLTFCTTSLLITAGVAKPIDTCGNE